MPKLAPIEMRTKYDNRFRIINVVNSYPKQIPEEITRADIDAFQKVQVVNSHIFKLIYKINQKNGR